MEKENIEGLIINRVQNSDYKFFTDYFELLKEKDILNLCSQHQQPLLFYYCLWLGYNKENYQKHFENFNHFNQKLIKKIQNLFNKKIVNITISDEYLHNILNCKYSIQDLRKLLNKGLIDMNSLYLHFNILNPEYLKELKIYGFTESSLTPIRLQEPPLVLDSIFRIVVFSDSHEGFPILPQGDILIFCGDFANNQNSSGDFLGWFAKQNFKYKIIVPGNHDPENFEVPPGVIMLNNKSINILGKNNIKIHGISSIPFRKESYNNSYSCMRRDMHYLYSQVPDNIDILITHFPAWGIGDYNTEITRSQPYESGDYCARKYIAEHNIRYHFFGHCHGMAGVYKFKEKNTISINCAQHIYQVLI